MNKIANLTLVLAIAGIPAIGLSATGFDPENPQTPGAMTPAEPQAVAPYVAGPDTYVPDSSKEQASGFAQTNFMLFNATGKQPTSLADLSFKKPSATVGPDSTFAEYPASLACLYQMGLPYPGCYPMNNPAYNATGGNRAIAIVIAYNNPTILSDLQYFSVLRFARAKCRRTLTNCFFDF